MQRLEHRLIDEPNNFRSNVNPDERAYADGIEGVDDALAEFGKMFEERHLPAGLLHSGCDGVIWLAVGHERVGFLEQALLPVGSPFLKLLALPFPWSKRPNGGWSLPRG